ncbi:MAG: hypothetical protein ISS25_01360 [Nanoarchaeota archaeon]|nr:hypothetical protein [DPANN group archaeon]MBL7116461.1 hypothetical protein [Nanoarchaeota archaeon]
MGIEAYLFRIRFKKKVDYSELDNFLKKYGFKVVESHDKDYKESFYELKSRKGVTEAHVYIGPDKDKLDSFYVRFSVISPPLVIEQTFDFFAALNEKSDLEVQDTEISNHEFLTTTKLDDRKIVDMEIPDEETYEKIMKKTVIPIDAKKFRENELGIRKRSMVLVKSWRKKPIRCQDTLRRMRRDAMLHLHYLEE